MFDHVTLRAADRAASERFYETVLTPLGITAAYSAGDFAEWDDFSLTQAHEPGVVTRGLHLGFAAPSRVLVDAFWVAGTAAGYESDGEPGARPQYREDYYGAFLRDPDGNSAEAVHHGALRRGGVIDHVWIRVADLTAATAFYRLVAAAAGFAVDRELPERTSFTGGPATGGTFSLVPGEPSANVHMAFPGDEGAVRRFHADATAAGYRDNGEPQERPRYHPGYYAAYVLDPDGNNIEVVDHHR
jgi:catechol 2,3-dioxygenase-like lactoylglutathione lyase family enzyme